MLHEHEQNVDVYHAIVRMLIILGINQYYVF